MITGGDKSLIETWTMPWSRRENAFTGVAPSVNTAEKVAAEDIG